MTIQDKKLFITSYQEQLYTPDMLKKLIIEDSTEHEISHKSFAAIIFESINTSNKNYPLIISLLLLEVEHKTSHLKKLTIPFKDDFIDACDEFSLKKIVCYYPFSALFSKISSYSSVNIEKFAKIAEQVSLEKLIEMYEIDSIVVKALMENNDHFNIDEIKTINNPLLTAIYELHHSSKIKDHEAIWKANSTDSFNEKIILYLDSKKYSKSFLIFFSTKKIPVLEELQNTLRANPLFSQRRLLIEIIMLQKKSSSLTPYILSVFAFILMKTVPTLSPIENKSPQITYR